MKGKKKLQYIGQPKKTWKMQVEKESKNAMNQVRWRVGVGEIAVRVG